MATTSMSHSSVSCPSLQTALGQAAPRGFLRAMLPNGKEPAIFCMASDMVGGAA
jgi:hypothetical protein